jgi:hypothetical protein
MELFIQTTHTLFQGESLRGKLAAGKMAELFESKLNIIETD